MPDPIPVLFYGLGTIGRSALDRAATDPRLRVVAAVDPREDLVGTPACDGVEIAASLDDALVNATTHPVVAVHATGSRLEQLIGQFEELLAAGLHVSTSCEEMIYPWYAAPDTADRLDARARQADRCIYGTGVNPGYVLDRLPATMATVTVRLTGIRARRIVDSATRRPQLRAKTGAGLSVEEFESRVASGSLGHVGLRESLEFLAASLGRNVTDVKHTLDPVLASTDEVAGAHEEIHARVGEVPVSLLLEIAIGSGPAVDEVEIDGDPPLHAVFEGGIAGGPATAAALVNGAVLATRSPGGISRR